MNDEIEAKREAIGKAAEEFADAIGEPFLDLHVGIRHGKAVTRDYRAVYEDREAGKVIELEPKHLRSKTK